MSSLGPLWCHGLCGWGVQCNTCERDGNVACLPGASKVYTVCVVCVPPVNPYVSGIRVGVGFREGRDFNRLPYADPHGRVLFL